MRAALNSGQYIHANIQQCKEDVADLHRALSEVEDVSNLGRNSLAYKTLSDAYEAKKLELMGLQNRKYTAAE